MQAIDIFAPRLEPHCGSWVVVVRATGRAAAEVFSRDVADAYARDPALEVVTAAQWLARFNAEVQAEKRASPFPEPGYRPGERIVAGKPAIFDLDALNDWLAVEAKRTAPDDLTALQDDALDALFWRSIRLAALSGHRDCELFERVSIEREARKMGRAA